MEKSCRVHSWQVVNDKGDAIESPWLDGLLDNMNHLNGLDPDTECRVVAIYEGKVHEVFEQILSDFPHKPVTQANLAALEHEIRELRRELHETLQAQSKDPPGAATSADIQRLEAAINGLRLAMAHNTVILDRVLDFIIFNGTGGPQVVLEEITGVLKPVEEREPK